MTDRNDERYVLNALRRDGSRVFARGSGSRLWDIDGKEYLDTMSGSAGPAMVGHSHPRVAAAVARQMETLPSVNILHSAVPVGELCARLADLAPNGLSRTFLTAGGGEAIEVALKFAELATGRVGTVSLTNGYHGWSLATMTLSTEPSIRWPTWSKTPSADAYRPQLDGWKASVEALDAALAGAEIAAFLMEVVQGPAGHVVFAPEYYQEVQRVCREHGTLLVVDEIQTGLARCGTLWACDLFDVRPDILVIGKALGGGVPIGAFIAREALVPEGLEREPWHIQTFMNQPLAAAAGLAVLDVVEEEGLVGRAADLGAKAFARFEEMATRYDVIGDVRGPGLFIGVDLVEDRTSKAPATEACAAAWEYALDQGLLMQFGGPGRNAIKFKPPLTTSEDELARMLELMEETIAFVERRVRG